MKIKVIDAIMGAGKTEYAIQLMNEDVNNRYIYVTPFLNEVERVRNSCSDRNFIEPKQLGNGKLKSLKEILYLQKNIVTTHALFGMADDEVIELLKIGNYVLILDEVMDVISVVDISVDDVRLLFDEKMLIEKDKDRLDWNTEFKNYRGRFNFIKTMAEKNRLIKVGDTILFWRFPADIFEAFSEVYVMTYLFGAQIQKYYYDLYGIDYSYYDIEKDKNRYYIQPISKVEGRSLEKIRNCLNILDFNLNEIGDKDYSLSYNYYMKNKNNKLIMGLIKNNIYNYFHNVIKGNSDENMWTCFLENKPKLKGKGYTKGFVVYNCRATNYYREKSNLAYMVNRFVNPIILKFFQDRNVKIDQDLFALSEMLQWIWRSRIREGKRINLYIPSKRMRELLQKWLET